MITSIWNLPWTPYTDIKQKQELYISAWSTLCYQSSTTADIQQYCVVCKQKKLSLHPTSENDESVKPEKAERRYVVKCLSFFHVRIVGISLASKEEEMGVRFNVNLRKHCRHRFLNYYRCRQTAFEIFVVRALRTTKKVDGQPKIPMQLSDGQP